MHHLQSHWIMCKENRCKLKEMYCRIQTNQQRCQRRGICPSKIPPSYSRVYMTSKKVRTVKIIICCYSLNRSKKHHVFVTLAFFLLCFSAACLSVPWWQSYTRLSVIIKGTPSYVIFGWDTFYSFSHPFINFVW